MRSEAGLRLPHFIAVGPPRTATTWLHEVLTGYVALPAGTKETQFFVWNYDLGIRWYAAHFRNCPPHLPAGEIAPTYFNSAEARARIARHIPQCRIVCTLRDPVERIYSHYKVWRKIGRIKAPFEQAAFNHRQLADYNRYAFHLRQWRDALGPENVLVLIYDDLEADPQRYVESLCSFVGIAPPDLRNSPLARQRVYAVNDAPKSQRLARRGRQVRDRLIRLRLYRLVDALEPLWDYCSGRGEKFPPLDPDLESRLRERFRSEVTELEQLLQRNLSSWKGAAERSGEIPPDAAIKAVRRN